jgi:hypothetical protein
MLSANQLGVRLIETFSTGVCYLLWGCVTFFVLYRAGIARRKLVTLGTCFVIMSGGAFSTHHGIYTGHMIDIAWGGVPSLFARITVTVMVIVTAPEIAQAWIMYHRAKAITKRDLRDFELDVRILPVRRLINRLRGTKGDRV